MAFQQQENAPSAEEIANIKDQLEPALEAMMAEIGIATQLAIRKAQEDAVNGKLYFTQDEENNPNANAAAAAAMPASILKGSGNTGRGNKITGEPNTTVKPISKKRSTTENDNTKPTQKVVDSSTIPKGQVRIEVLASTNQKLLGMVRVVKPLAPSSKERAHVRIGRSNGKEYVQYGFHIEKDMEVSSNHATIYRKNGQFFWVDNGSTNGSVMNYPDKAEGTVGLRRHLAPDDLTPLEDGTIMQLGLCELQINFFSA